MLFQGLWGNDEIGLGSCNLKELGVLLHWHVSLLDTFHAELLEGLDEPHKLVDGGAKGSGCGSFTHV